MARKQVPGLIKRGETWHIDKIIRRIRACESTGTSNLEEAEKYPVHRTEEIRQAEVYGVRPKRTFRRAATRYLGEATKASLDRDAQLLRSLDSFIGGLHLEGVHMGSLQAYIQDRSEAKWKKRTVNYGLQVVRHILNLAASEWMDEHGMTWLAHAPKIRLLRQDDQKPPYPPSPEEQTRLFAELPDHPANMALFKVNTGCREAEVCGLKWEWEIEVPSLDTSSLHHPGTPRQKQTRPPCGSQSGCRGCHRGNAEGTS